MQWVEAVDGSWKLPMCDPLQFPDTDNCSRPEVIPTWPIFVHVHGLISPGVILFTLVTNVLVCAVLLRPSMRSATRSHGRRCVELPSVTRCLELPGVTLARDARHD